MDNSKKRKQTKKRGGTVVLSVIFVFLSLFLAVFLYGVSKLSKISYDEPAPQGTVTESAQTALAPMTQTEIREGIAEAAASQSIELPQGKAESAADIVNVLLLGTDFRVPGTDDPGRADSTMLCSLNTKTGEVKLVSFERGIYVPVPEVGQDLLTHAYHWGGATLSQSIIEECFLLDVSGYAQVDFANFKLVIDTIGGVDITLTETEAAELKLPAGVNHMNGAQALSYCRLRSIDSDWERQQRQRNTIVAALKQTRKLSVSELDSMLNTLLPLIHTNLSKTQISRLMLSAGKFIQGDISQLQVPDQNWTNGYIECDFDYEHKKITNFVYGTDYDITSPY